MRLRILLEKAPPKRPPIGLSLTQHELRLDILTPPKLIKYLLTLLNLKDNWHFKLKIINQINTLKLNLDFL